MAVGFMILCATTLLLLLSLSPTPTTGGTDISDTLVLDVNGNPLDAGTEYYIVAADEGLGRGIIRSPKSQCPGYAVVSSIEDDYGEPVKVIPTRIQDVQVHLFSPVRIDSGLSTSCGTHGMWKVSPDSGEIITAGAPLIPSSLFYIFLRRLDPRPTYGMMYFTSDMGIFMSVLKSDSGLDVLACPTPRTGLSNRNGVDLVFIQRNQTLEYKPTYYVSAS